MKLVLALLVALASSPACADEKVWSLLKGGGQVVLIRHAVTTPGVGDPPGLRLDDCSTQRNLTDAGRGHARLAFGREHAVSGALGNLFGRHENRERQVRELRALVASHAGKGNLVLVTHGSTIAALTGINPGTGEMVVLSKGAVAGRLSVPET